MPDSYCGGGHQTGSHASEMENCPKKRKRHFPLSERFTYSLRSVLFFLSAILSATVYVMLIVEGEERWCSIRKYLVICGLFALILAYSVHALIQATSPSEKKKRQVSEVIQQKQGYADEEEDEPRGVTHVMKAALPTISYLEAAFNIFAASISLVTLLLGQGHRPFLSAFYAVGSAFAITATAFSVAISRPPLPVHPAGGNERRDNNYTKQLYIYYMGRLVSFASLVLSSVGLTMAITYIANPTYESFSTWGIVKLLVSIGWASVAMSSFALLQLKARIAGHSKVECSTTQQRLLSHHPPQDASPQSFVVRISTSPGKESSSSRSV